jgi:hypothetical protein
MLIGGVSLVLSRVKHRTGLLRSACGGTQLLRTSGALHLNNFEQPDNYVRRELKMAKMKTVGVEAKLGEKFKMEVKAGDHVMYIDQPKAAAGPTREQPRWNICLRLSRAVSGRWQESSPSRKESS